jgi:ComF family protein
MCKNCRNKKIFYNQLLSIALYREPLLSLIHLFKYRHYDFLKIFFSSLIGNHLKRIGFNSSSYDFILSVPSHPLRIKEREYNQAQILAEGIADYFDLPVRDDILLCKKYHKSQTKISRKERLQNIKNVFFVKENLAGKNIILVDDVVTTGTTIYECSKVLKEKGANKITVITLAKAR